MSLWSGEGGGGERMEEVEEKEEELIEKSSLSYSVLC